MRRIGLILLAAASGAFAAVAGADDTRTYKIELYNAFGIVEQADFRVGGVNVGSVTDLTVNEDKRAVVTVEVSGDLATLGDETTCESNPQSLLGEYFLDCDPAGKPLPDGGTIPASRVSQNVQPDLVQNTMREPFRLRLQLLLPLVRIEAGEHPLPIQPCGCGFGRQLLRNFGRRGRERRRSIGRAIRRRH